MFLLNTFTILFLEGKNPEERKIIDRNSINVCYLGKKNNANS